LEDDRGLKEPHVGKSKGWIVDRQEGPETHVEEGPGFWTSVNPVSTTLTPMTKIRAFLPVI
jgi:hypothetical protein